MGPLTLLVGVEIAPPFPRQFDTVPQEPEFGQSFHLST